MKFLIDAQLPARLVYLLAEAGHDAIHTSQLSEGNQTTDTAVATLADVEDRVVVTKDRDFRDWHLLHNSPRRLLIVTVGNISNTDLSALFTENLGAFVDSLTQAAFVELGPTGLVVHKNVD